jgi:hypothetical protein
MPGRRPSRTGSTFSVSIRSPAASLAHSRSLQPQASRRGTHLDRATRMTACH